MTSEPSHPRPPSGLEAWRPLEAALVAFHDRGEPGEVLVRSDAGDPTTLPAATFFRSPDELEEWEKAALGRCGPRVLDVGAGVGAHALALQGRGHGVTALEILPEAVRIMMQRGVRDARRGTVFDQPCEAIYDSVLILMNGSMLAETLAGLGTLLQWVRGMLRPGGSLLLDSTDLRDGDERLPDGRYVGELHFQLSFGDFRGEVFPQLFVDPETLDARARPFGWETAIIWEGEGGRFLAELTST